MSNRNGYNEDEPYFMSQLQCRINLLPKQLNKNFERNLALNLKNKVEGKCLKEGYVRPNSTTITKRSQGYYKGNHFLGELTFDIEYVADICRPFKGDIIIAQVVNKNKLGLIAKKGPLNIFAILQHCNNASFFEEGISVGSLIKFEVNSIKFQPGSDTITVICKIIELMGDYELPLNKFKSISLMNNNNIEDIKLITKTKIAENEYIYGFDEYVKIIKRTYRKNQYNLQKYCLELIKSDIIKKKSNTTEEEQSIKMSSLKCRKIRALTNLYEMIYPSAFYSQPLFTEFKKPIDRAFFKLWEIIEDYNLLPTKKEADKIVTAHLAEDPGSFVEATLKWREFTGDGKNINDLPFGISLKEETVSAPGIPLDKMESIFKKDYPNFKAIYGGEKGHPNPPGYKKRQGDGTGDIFKLGNILDFAADVNSEGGAFLVTSDLGFDFEEVENIREQVMYFPIFSQIVAALSCQKVDGNVVIKIFDVFTSLTAKLIILLSSFYNEFYVTKPFTSRIGNSEKYIVGKGFKGITKNELNILYNMFKEWNKIEPHIGAKYPNNKNFVTDIDNLCLSKNNIRDLFNFNMMNIRQRQIRTINKMNEYIHNEPSIDKENEIKQEQTKIALTWFSHYNYNI